MKRSRVNPLEYETCRGLRELSWSYTIPTKGYSRFCGDCNRRVMSRPSQTCTFPQHSATFERAKELRMNPGQLRPKSRDGRGWTRRLRKYGRVVCSSCLKEINCSPSANCKSGQHRAYYEETRGALKEKHWEAKVAVIELLGGNCIDCGMTDIRLLQVNHVHHDGGKDQLRRSTTKFFTWILKGKLPRSRFDLRWANCNILYEYESGRVSVPEKFLEWTSLGAPHI